MPDILKDRSTWVAVDAWADASLQADRSATGYTQSGVILRPLRHVDMIGIAAAGGGGTTALERIAEECLGFRPPAPGRARFGPAGGLVWSGVGQWMAIAAAAGALDRLTDAIAGVAALTRHGDGRALVEIEGPRARTMLAKCLSIDLHPEVFTAGSAAFTAFAHTAVQLWVREGPDSLTLCVPRTVAGSVWRILTASAAEYGVLVERL